MGETVGWSKEVMWSKEVNIYTPRERWCGGARLADRRRRARERVRGMSESPQATTRIGWGGWLKEVSGCHAVVLVTCLTASSSYGIGWGGCG